MTLYDSYGTAHYYKGCKSCRLILEVDNAISNYYFSLMPNYIKANIVKHCGCKHAHISVVRKERPLKPEYYGKYDGALIYFQYEPIVYSDGTFYWLNCFSRRLEEIRLELGLPATPRYCFPESPFHITLAISPKLRRIKIKAQRIKIKAV